MRQPITHALIRHYFARFDRAAEPLPAHRRAALREELMTHLEEALPDNADDSAVAAELSRLGSPDAIVADEAAPSAPMTANGRAGHAGRLVLVTVVAILSVLLVLAALPLLLVVLFLPAALATWWAYTLGALVLLAGTGLFFAIRALRRR